MHMRGPTPGIAGVTVVADGVAPGDPGAACMSASTDRRMDRRASRRSGSKWPLPSATIVLFRNARWNCLMLSV